MELGFLDFVKVIFFDGRFRGFVLMGLIMKRGLVVRKDYCFWYYFFCFFFCYLFFGFGFWNWFFFYELKNYLCIDVKCFEFKLYFCEY